MSVEEPEVPEGMRPDARETWPSRELIDSFFGGGFDFEYRLGEYAPVPDDPGVAARERQFRDVLGLFATGVTVITSMAGGRPVGMTCQSFSSVSLDPPLVLFCPAKTSRAWPLMRSAGYFCVNLLSAEQQHLSDGMASKGQEKYADVAWHAAPVTGAPVLDGVLGHIDCTIDRVHEAGDHYIVVGRVQRLAVGDSGDSGDSGESGVSGGAEASGSGEPLLFFRGAYGRREA